ncbi:MAG: GTP-binding protein LepA [Parcubacteria group bacterium Gr01-1014_73]|nr:MAG: GTP-binding protein LepA [Parcubacteria group bacterium Gr01-1014_73]
MEKINHIRNFCIIAHIDHGKSTLADRFLELTGTIEKRKMTEQVLDWMELERERGITIKMKPVRMIYGDYVLNLVDTPGHIDFSYDVSRALRAVEGAILLVDATQGVQAQTLTTLEMAREAGLMIIPVVTKIDSPLARIAETKTEMAKILNDESMEILEVSGKTGQGVAQLLTTIIDKIPPPKITDVKNFRGLIFDFKYSNHTGITIFLRVFEGIISKKDKLAFAVSQKKFTPIDIGVFTPMETPAETLGAGEIGYITTGIKEPGIALVGDTVVTADKNLPPLEGYLAPKPVVWASLYPESQNHWNDLRQALERLRLSDSSFTHEEESSGVLGRGFRCGFLGMLHLEIVAERLRREFNLSLVVTLPSITYEILDKRNKKLLIYSPSQFPTDGDIQKIFEPWAKIKIITPADYLGEIIQLVHRHEATINQTETFSGNRNSLELAMPLRELMRDFFDEIKSATSGFASLSYKIIESQEADVAKLEILVAEESVPAFARIVSRARLQEEAEAAVEKLYKILPRQLFTAKIQAKALGRIIASRTLKALRKDVTGYLYGGDISRKRKLWEQQKEGKKRLKEQGRVNIPPAVFLKMIKKE